MVINPNCDGARCRRKEGEVRRLPTGAGGNAILCYECYRWEMMHRHYMNTFYHLSKENRYETPSWESLEVYEG